MVDHRSVLYKEVLEALSVKPGEIYVDATLNGGGHTKGILGLGGRVVGIDLDPQAIERVAKTFSLKVTTEDEKIIGKSKSLIATQGNFANLREIVSEFGVWETPGILFDLGLSSFQLDDEARGFSFSKPGPLDMRFDPRLAVRAADLINGLNEGELHELFAKYGEEHASRSIACAIVEARVKERIETTTQLVDVINNVVRRREKIHPATRVFQALRIAVNDELNNLRKGLEEAADLLKVGGRLVVISFHSLEDGTVKRFLAERCDFKSLTKKPIVPAKEEILENPRARSAKMRVAEKQ